MLKLLKNITLLTGFFWYGQYLEAQNCNFTCKDTVFAVLDSNCQTLVTADDAILDKGNCSNDFVLKITDFIGKSVSNVFGKNDIGKLYHTHLTHLQSNQPVCVSVLKIVDKTGPKMVCQDVFADCRAYSMVTDNVFTPPAPLDNCAQVIGLEHNDKYFDMSCQQKGFTGPFDISRWEKQSLCQSNSKISISALQDSLQLLNGLTPDACITALSFKMPFEGILRMKWSSDPANMTSGDSFGIRVNGIFVRLDTASNITGSVATKLLNKEMLFEWVVYADGAGQPFMVSITNLESESSLKAFVERRWNAFDAYGNKNSCLQSIFILKNYVDEVFFPVDVTDSIKVQKNCTGNYSPDITGWPYLKTGKYNTSLGIIQIKPGSSECLQVSYTDQTNKICEGSYEIQRKWKIIENCTGDSIIHDQMIRVLDLAAPIISSPALLSMPVHDNDCVADVTIPACTATDLCSPNGMTTSITTSFGGSGSGPFADIPTGQYKVTYTAIDGCGNKSSKMIDLEVKDLTAPLAKCKQNLSLYLDGAGEANISASATDNGSTDNCCLTEIKIKRKNDQQAAFVPTLKFTCADAPKVQVALRATDCNGNIAVCDATVSIADNIPPVVVCPGDVTVSCSTDLTQLDAYGSPIVTDNCNAKTLYSFTQNLNSCNEGTVYRSWQVSDAGNNTAVCVQSIFVTNKHDWNASNDKIFWPKDYTTNECKTTAELKPSFLPQGFSQPAIKDNSKCTNVEIKYDDTNFGQGSVGCVEIHRKWSIIEKCTYAATNGTAGKWEHTQIIKVTDNIPPSLNVPADVTVFITDNSCSAFVDLPAISVTDCDPNPIIANNKTNKPTNLSATYQAGVNKVEVTATDHCGNTISRAVTITVLDGMPPQVLCKQNVSINLENLDATGNMELIPEMISNGYTDNCSPDFMIKTSVFPTNISCSDLGKTNITLTVSDLSGNTAFCVSEITITDANQLCSKPLYRISGNIRTADNKPVLAANVALNWGNTAIIKTKDGSFLFDKLTQGGNFDLSATKDTFVLNGISTYDLLLLNEHILGKKILDSPYKYIAADVNQNNYITTADYVILKDLLLLNIDSLPGGKSWRFVPDTFQFVNYHPILPLFPEKISVKNLQHDVTDANFVGVKLGDLNFSNNPSKVVDVDVRGEESVEIEISGIETSVANEIRVPFVLRSDKPLKGIQFELMLADMDVDKYTMLLPAQMKCNRQDVNFISTGNGTKMRLSWISTDDIQLVEGDTLLYLVLKNLSGNDFLEKIQLTMNAIQPEAYDADYKIHKLMIREIANESVSTQKGNMLIFPNPVKDYFQIHFENKYAEQADIALIDLSGRTILGQSVALKSGNNQFRFSHIDKMSSGLYLLQLKTENGRIFHQKIFVERH